MKKYFVAILLLLTCNSYTIAKQTVNIIVPQSAGGATDTLARKWVEHLNSVLDKDQLQLVIDYKPSAGGIVGINQVANTSADELLLLFASNSVAINYVIAGVNWKMHKDLVPMAHAGTTPMVVVVKKTSDIFLPSDIAKTKKALAVGHAGQGSAGWLAALSLGKKLKTEFNLIGYKGGAPVLIDLLGGHIDMSVDFYSTSIQHINSHALRAVMVLTDERLSDLPSVPAYPELGMGGFPTPIWWGIFSNNSNHKDKLLIIQNAINMSYTDKKFLLEVEKLGYQIKNIDVKKYIDQQIHLIQDLNVKKE